MKHLIKEISNTANYISINEIPEGVKSYYRYHLTDRELIARYFPDYLEDGLEHDLDWFDDDSIISVMVYRCHYTNNRRGKLNMKVLNKKTIQRLNKMYDKRLSIELCVKEFKKARYHGNIENIYKWRHNLKKQCNEFIELFQEERAEKLKAFFKT